MKTRIGSYPNLKSIHYVTMIVFLWGLSDALVSFFLPIQMQRFLHNLALFGVLFGLSSLVGAVADPILGFLSNRARYVALLAIGLFLSAVLIVLANVPFSILIIIWLMSLWGLYYEFINIGIFSYVSRHHEKGDQSRYFGLIYLFMNLAYVIGPLVGGYLVFYGNKATYGLAYIFITLGALFLPKLISLHRHRERPLVAYGTRRLYNIRQQLKSFRKVWGYASVLFIAIFLYNVWDSFVWTLVPIQSIGGSAILAGITTSMFTIPLALFEGYAGKVADRFGRNATFVAGLFVAALCTLLFGTQQAMLPKVMLAGLASLGFAFAYPALMGGTSEDGLEHRSELGNIAGVQRIFVNAGFVLGPVIGGFVASRYGIQKAFFELGAVMLVCFVPITIAMMRFRVAGRIHKRILAEFDM